jgi:hypothetical protein
MVHMTPVYVMNALSVKRLRRPTLLKTAAQSGWNR